MPTPPPVGLGSCSPHRARACSRASPAPACSPGFGFLTVAEAGWAHAIGVVALLGFIVCGFLAVVPAQLADDPRD